MTWQRSGHEQEKAGALILHSLFISVRLSIENVPQALSGPPLGDVRAQKCSWLLQIWQALSHTVLSPQDRFCSP